MRKAAITAAFARTPLGEELPLLGVALDRGAVARADLDPLRLRLLRLLQVDLEDPVLVVGVDVALGDALRHPERARERPVATLEAVEPLVRLLLRALTLGCDRQRSVVELHRDLVLGNARQVKRVDELGLRLPNVERRHPGLIRTTVALEEAVHETTHLVLESRDLTERLPANQSCHLSSFHQLDFKDRIKPKCFVVKSNPE